MKKININELLSLLKEKKFKEVKEIFENTPIIDISDEVNTLDEGELNENITYLLYIFKIVKPEISAEFFSNLNSEIQSKLINSLNDEEIQKLVEISSNDDLTDFISYWPANVVTKIFKNTSKNDREIINKLLGYKEDSAGSIMTSEYLTLLDDMEVKDAISLIRKEGRKAETIYTLFVKNKSFDLVGVLELDDLIFANEESLLKDIISKNYLTCNVDDDQEDVAKIFKRYDLNALAVLNEDNKLTGIITIDDIMDVLEKEKNEDIEAMNKVTPLEHSYTETGVFKLAFKCIPWLIILIVFNIGSMALQNEFQDIISSLAVVSIFLTMVCDCAGNSGSQASTLMIRGLSTGDFKTSDFFKILWKEFRVAFITGIVVAIFNFLWVLFMFSVQIIDIQPGNSAGVNDDLLTWVALSGIVSLTLFLNIILSKILGLVLVFGLSKFKLDPAVIAGPAITTVMDIVSLGIYFGTISWVLSSGLLSGL